MSEDQELLMLAVCNGVACAFLALASGGIFGIAGVPNGVIAVLLLAAWLRGRRRKRTGRAFGAKSGAAIEALARRMREGSAPGPVTVPA